MASLVASSTRKPSSTSSKVRFRTEGVEHAQVHARLSARDAYILVLSDIP